MVETVGYKYEFGKGVDKSGPIIREGGLVNFQWNIFSDSKYNTHSFRQGAPPVGSPRCPRKPVDISDSNRPEFSYALTHAYILNK